MNKKIILSLVTVLAVVAGVAGMAAWEAHVINVTAHIENALNVHLKEIAFGTVFPQEYVEDSFTVNLSESFIGEIDADDVEYVIKQKPKPLDADPSPLVWAKPESCNQPLADVYEARAHCHAFPGDMDCCYEDLCQFLSKMDDDTDGEDASGAPLYNDIGVPSYYNDNGTPLDKSDDSCLTPSPTHATGLLAKSWGVYGDLSDDWIVDLKVPPVAGFIGQDWPETCADWTVPVDGADYGCDLWIEVTGISRYSD